MKAPSKNISASLRSQHQAAAHEMPITVSRLKSGKSAGVYPGERGVERPPGRVKPESAAHFATVMKKAGGE